MSYLADGQVAATATALVDASGANPGSGTITSDTRVNITLFNTSTTLSETVVLTYTRSQTNVARRIYRGAMAANEYAILLNVPFVVGDKILGSTSDASTVDYTVSIAAGQGQFSVGSFDANGSLKQVNTGISGSQTISGSEINSGVFSSTALAASADNLAIGAVYQVRLSTNAGGSQNVTGMTGGVQGMNVIITNVGATDSLVIKHDATSTAANRFYCANAADVTLRIRGSVQAIYDGTLLRWCVGGA